MLKPGWAYAVSAGIVIVVTVVLHLLALRASPEGAETGKRRGLLALVVGVDNRVSTSKLQLILWTYAIAFVFLAIVLEGRADDVLEAGLEVQYLFLLGIPVVGAAGAALITTTKVETGKVDKPMDEAAEASNVLKAVQEGLADVVTDDTGRGDIGDFQYFVFNLVALTYFFTAFFGAAADVLPVIPDTLVALTGASAFAYLSKKGLVTNVPHLTGVYPSTASAGDQVTVRGVNLVGTSSLRERTDPSRGLVIKLGGLLGTNVTFPDPSDPTKVTTLVPATAKPGQTEVRAVTSGGIETETGLPFTVV